MQSITSVRDLEGTGILKHRSSMTVLSPTTSSIYILSFIESSPANVIPGGNSRFSGHSCYLLKYRTKSSCKELVSLVNRVAWLFFLCLLDKEKKQMKVAVRKKAWADSRDRGEERCTVDKEGEKFELQRKLRLNLVRALRKEVSIRALNCTC